MPETAPKHLVLLFDVSVALEDDLSGYLMMNFTVEGVEEAADGSMKYFIPIEEWTLDTQGRLDAFLASLPKGEVKFQGTDELEERDWNAEWEASIEPQQITEKLVVTPSWKMEDALAMSYKHLITIDPKMSFGTGHHETTRLCLKASEQIDVAGKTVLDIGTGSGLLAIYALKRGAKHAIGIDTDHWSFENATENRALNGIDVSQLDIRLGELSATVTSDERFDVIFANIHRNVLLAIAPEIHAHANPGATIILSGLLIYDADEIAATYAAAGMKCVNRLQENEWVALILEKE